MHFLNKVLIFYINASIHVALAAVCFVIITLKEYNLESPISLNLFVFCATVAGYNFVKYFGSDSNHFLSLTKHLKLIFWLSIFSATVAVYFTTLFEAESVLLILGSCFITLFYTFPKVPFKLFRSSVSNLRIIPGFKVYLVALVWVLITYLLPLIELSESFESDMVISAIQRFLILIVLILPFEIRDLQFDNLKLETIPQKIGVNNTKLLGFILITVIAILEYSKAQNHAIFTVTLLTILMISAVFLRFAKINSARNYTIFWVEAIPVFWLFLLLFFQMLLN